MENDCMIIVVVEVAWWKGFALEQRKTLSMVER